MSVWACVSLQLNQLTDFFRGLVRTLRHIEVANGSAFRESLIRKLPWFIRLLKPFLHILRFQGEFLFCTIKFVVYSRTVSCVCVLFWLSLTFTGGSHRRTRNLFAVGPSQ